MIEYNTDKFVKYIPLALASLLVTLIYPLSHTYLVLSLLVLGAIFIPLAGGNYVRRLASMQSLKNKYVVWYVLGVLLFVVSGGTYFFVDVLSNWMLAVENFKTAHAQGSVELPEMTHMLLGGLQTVLAGLGQIVFATSLGVLSAAQDTKLVGRDGFR